jgi:hypothetical protein
MEALIMSRKVAIIYGTALLAVAGIGVIFVGRDLPAANGRSTQTEYSPVEQERQLSTIQKHTAAQDRLVHALIAKQLTLQQAAEQLLDLHTVNPYFNWQVFRDAYSGATDQERCCCQLLALVRWERNPCNAGSCRNPQNPAPDPKSARQKTPGMGSNPSSWGIMRSVVR